MRSCINAHGTVVAERRFINSQVYDIAETIVMEPSRDKNPSSVYRLSYSLLTVLLLLTVGATLAFYKNAAEKDSVKFNATANRLQTEIENKVNLYVTLLAGLRGFITTTPNLDHDRFASYVESLNMRTNYPALLRVGYVQTASSAENAAIRDKTVITPHPNPGDAAPEKPRREVLTYVAPSDDAARKAIGTDLSTDPNWLGTMDLAASTGKAAMSGRLEPIIDSDPKGPVIALFLPIYKEAGVSQGAANGEQTPVGYVYTSFTPAAFVTDIDKVLVDKEVAIQLFDGEETEANFLGESSHAKPAISGFLGEQQSLKTEFMVAGRKWLSRFNSLPAFGDHSAVGWAPMLFIAGTSFSFLVFGFTYKDASRRYELQKLTGELLVTQKEKESLFEMEQHARLEAEEANRVKDDFLAIVSHELKTPLNTIAGWTTILKSDHLSASTKETALQKIEKNLRLQAKMVEQILSFSQIMAEDRPLSLAPVSASEIFAKAIRAIEPAAAEKSVAFSSSNELNGQMINADPETIGMALGNILSNAVKFTPSGGMIQARAVSENGDVRFVVEDNGSGIEPDFIPHVFEHYKQGAEPATRSYGGLGLGLAITKHIVDLHGGSVETASEGLGRGAQFTVSIPEIKVSESN